MSELSIVSSLREKRLCGAALKRGLPQTLWSGSISVIADMPLAIDLPVGAGSALISHENKRRMGAWRGPQDFASRAGKGRLGCVGYHG